jgi:hypothetical protein
MIDKVKCKRNTIKCEKQAREKKNAKQKFKRKGIKRKKGRSLAK